MSEPWPARMLGRFVMTKTDAGYEAEAPLYAFRYHAVVKKLGGDVVLEVYDGPPYGPYRIGVLDGDQD